MREKNRNSIEIEKMLPQFTTMNVIDGQAGLMSYSSLIFYSLTIDNILNIVVLLILAGVTIATLTGKNGILTRATEAKGQTEIGEEKEAIGLAFNGVMADSLGEGVEAGKLQDELRNNGYKNVTANNNENGTITVRFPNTGRSYLVDNNGNITEAGTGEVTPPATTGKTDGSFDTVKGVNTPKLKDNMQLVVYNNGNWVKDTTKSAYKYEAQTGATDTYNEETGEYGTSHWANAELDGNYYVWIPRYAYRIDKSTQYTSQSGTSYKIDVKFLIGTTDQYYGDNGELKEAKIATNADEISAEGNTDYYVHPAFTFGDTPLEGLWIGKYESSDAGSNKIAIIPNAISLTGINVSTMFSRAQTLSRENINAHMLKNIEWGAVAYLTQSQYGRNGTEVSVNQCEGHITGAGKTEGNNEIYENTAYSITPEKIAGTEQAYDGDIGKLSSTTGNVYGIYDISGGATECVMGVYGTNGSPVVGNSGFTEFPDSKYYNLYTTTSSNNTNIGDALYETSEWNSDDTNFVHSNGQFFHRGGHYNNASYSGVFAFGSSEGMERWK